MRTQCEFTHDHITLARHAGNMRPHALLSGNYTFWKSIPVGNCKFYQYSIFFEGYANKIDDLLNNLVQSVPGVLVEIFRFYS